MTPRAQAVLEFWFAGAAQSADALEQQARFWFGTEQSKAELVAQDDVMRSRFAGLVDQAVRGELDSWAASPRGRLALILLLDQFPRNILRGSGRAFSGDAAALALTCEGLQLGADRLLTGCERVFFYMPLQHAESVPMQERSVTALSSLVNEAGEQERGFVEMCLPYALLHRDIVRRFGRFPHRNALLSRESTPAEQAYLAADAPDFGQHS